MKGMMRAKHYCEECGAEYDASVKVCPLDGAPTLAGTMMATPSAIDTRREAAIDDTPPLRPTVGAKTPAVRSFSAEDSLPPDLEDEPETSAAVLPGRTVSTSPVFDDEDDASTGFGGVAPNLSATVRRPSVPEMAALPPEIARRERKNSAPTLRAPAFDEAASQARSSAPTAMAPALSVRGELQEPVRSAPPRAEPRPQRTPTLRTSLAGGGIGGAVANPEDWASPLRPSVVRRMPLAPSKRFRALNAWQRRVALVLLPLLLCGGGYGVWSLMQRETSQREALFAGAQAQVEEKVTLTLRSSPEGARVTIEADGAPLDTLFTPGELTVKKGTALSLRFEYTGREATSTRLIAEEDKDLLVSLALLPPAPVAVNEPAPAKPTPEEPPKVRPSRPTGKSTVTISASKPPTGKTKVDPKSRNPLPPSTDLE